MEDDYAAVLQFPAMLSAGKEEKGATAGFGADSVRICRGAGRPSALPSPANTAIGVYTFVGARPKTSGCGESGQSARASMCGACAGLHL